MTTISSDALVSSIQSEIQRVQDDLIGVEENLKRLTGRDFNEPRGERRIRQISTGEREDEPPPKRRPPGGVFARLGDLVTETPRGRRVHEVLEDGEIPRQKPSVASSVARPINDGKSRTEAAAELTRDRASRDRNRRMFGALLGTLQRFRTEEAKQKGKDEQRAKIEKKLEEKGRAEKEELRKERIELINQRKERQLRIERLNFKIERVKEHEAWEAGQRRLGKFIRSQSKPRIFWLPKINNSRTSAMISQTKHSIERELEEARLRLKDELDEVLGGRMNYSFKTNIQEREREVDNDDFNNGSDLLDYDAEEGELVYDDLLLSGKQKQKGIGSERRVVVQVDSDVNRAPQRRVELVTVVAERGRRVKEVEENESEKENVIKSKVNVEHKKVIENGGDKGRGKEKEKKKEKEKDKSRGKEKHIDKKVSPEKHQKSHSRDSSKKESKSSRKEKKKEETVKIREVENEKLPENQAKNTVESDKSDNDEDEDKVTSDANITNEEENSTHGTEDLSQISLPLDPEPESTPKITEVVVQHVPLNSNDDSQNANEEEMQVETVLLDTSQIKQDKTDWDNEFPPLPIVIKKEKDATPEKATEDQREVTLKPRDENNQRKKEDSSSDSSDSDSDSSAESEDDDDDDESSSEDSSSESSSSDEEDRKKKKKDKDKDKDKGRSKRKEDSSSSESSESDDSESESDSSSDDERKKKKKDVEKRKPSPKYSRRSEKEKESDRKKVEKKKDARKSSRSRSRSRGRRSRSRDKRRVRSRSRDRRRDRR
ncbi:Pinin [Armadillidium nasatum]|uniref:Pinin n=1 Tax=Armadillidium nasatum TaxID=96803 RepID=A0A5N5T2V7_9CRUS|nr:Pinin [Armadillidium nasatum]